MEETFAFINASFNSLVVLIKANQLQAMLALFLSGMVGGSRNSVLWRAIWILASYFPMLFVVVTLTSLAPDREWEILITVFIVAVSSAIIWRANYKPSPEKKG